jgi:hypothetical protein
VPYFLIIPLWFASMIIIAPLFFVRSAKRFSVRWMLGSTFGVWIPWVALLLLPRGPVLFFWSKFIILPMIAFAWWGVSIADRLGRKYHWQE